MQGDKAAASIIAALDRIFEEEEHFDAVVIIRGGGAQADLDCFNNYDLAFHITQFPLPVFTGIGHERDETIADLVANRRLKTPTAVAEFLIDSLSDFLEFLESGEQRLLDISRHYLQTEKDRLSGLSRDLSYLVNRKLTESRAYLNSVNRHLASSTRGLLAQQAVNISQKRKLTYLYSQNLMGRQKRELKYQAGELKKITPAFLAARKDQLGQFEKQNHFLNPRHILKRGYSITLSNGKVVTDAASLSHRRGDHHRLIFRTAEKYNF